MIDFHRPGHIYYQGVGLEEFHHVLISKHYLVIDNVLLFLRPYKATKITYSISFGRQLRSKHPLWWNYDLVKQSIHTPYNKKVQFYLAVVVPPIICVHYWIWLKWLPKTIICMVLCQSFKALTIKAYKLKSVCLSVRPSVCLIVMSITHCINWYWTSIDNNHIPWQLRVNIIEPDNIFLLIY